MEYLYRVGAINRGGRNYLLRLYPIQRGLEYLPGQFINILYSNLERSYSIASHPSYPYLELFITNIGGAFTSKLDELYGKEVIIKGPYGRFTYHNQKSAVFISTGSGIAPIMSILRHIYSSELEGDFYLFSSFRFREENLYESELRLMSRLGLNIDIRYTGEGDSRFNIEDFVEYKEMDMYLCGNREFIMNIVRELKPRRVFVETWG
ncbi:MAG: FAD-binding oxidoreductase [Candidatus Anstonellales archaeon]